MKRSIDFTDSNGQGDKIENPRKKQKMNEKWPCEECTFLNEEVQSACSICQTLRNHKNLSNTNMDENSSLSVIFKIRQDQKNNHKKLTEEFLKKENAPHEHQSQVLFPVFYSTTSQQS